MRKTRVIWIVRAKPNKWRGKDVSAAFNLGDRLRTVGQLNADPGGVSTQLFLRRIQLHGDLASGQSKTSRQRLRAELKELATPGSVPGELRRVYRRARLRSAAIAPMTCGDEGRLSPWMTSVATIHRAFLRPCRVPLRSIQRNERTAYRYPMHGGFRAYAGPIRRVRLFECQVAYQSWFPLSAHSNPKFHVSGHQRSCSFSSSPNPAAISISRQSCLADQSPAASHPRDRG